MSDQVGRAFRERLHDDVTEGEIVAGLLDVVRQRLDPAFIALWSESNTPVVGDVVLSSFAVDDPLVGWALRHAEPTAIEQIELAIETLATMRNAGVTVVAPLVSLGTVVGLLLLGARDDGSAYQADDLAFLDELCALSAAALRVARLTNMSVAAERASETSAEELRLAQSIQRSLLPRELPTIDGWQIDAHYQPARVIGGDLYDFIPLPGDLLGILLGDASDKSVPAALMMATARTLLRAAGQRMVLPGLVLARVNDLLCDQLPPGMFVTCFFGVLDPASGRLRFANAGQCLPNLFIGGSVTELRATGWALGMMPGVSYDEREVVIPEGGTVVMFSDGLIETHDPSGTMFGTGRVAEILTETADDDRVISKLLTAHRDFAGREWDQEDDLTIVAIARNAPVATVEAQAINDRTLLLELELPSESGIERFAAERVGDALGDLPLTERQRERLKMAISEAVMNAIEHGNRFRSDLTVTVHVTSGPHDLSVIIADQGRGGEIPSATEPDIDAKLAGLQSPRGWGLFLIERLVDEFRADSTPNGHVMELVVRFGAELRDIIEQ